MKTLHVISHTHWDREWYLTFQQFRLKLVQLIDNLLEILDMDPDFKYFMLDGQTIVLEDYLQIRPENEEILRQHIQNGRILIGPWHILPDMFLVSGEAHIRNLLQGERTCRRFGPKMPVGYIPDPFGHPGQVPQILKGFGIETAALWRGVSDLPVECWWDSPNGSRVFLAYLRDSYSNGANLPVAYPEQFAEQVAAAGASLAAHSKTDDYLIMLGTDHMQPSPVTSVAIGYANQHLPDTRVVHSTIPAYIEKVRLQLSHIEDSLPILRGELRACDRSHLLPGVLSTRMWIKQRNQHSQTLLEKWAEPFSVFAQHLIEVPNPSSLVSQPLRPVIAGDRVKQPAQIIRHAWHLLMENHPHDSICGCSIDQVHDEMKPRFDQVDQIGEEITRQALHSIAEAVDTSSQDAFSSIVLFNPHGFSERGAVEIEVNIPEGIPAFELVDGDRKRLPYEFAGSSNEELANILVKKDGLRDTIGYIHEGQVAGFAISDVKITRQETVVTIEAVLDPKGKPNLRAWQQAEESIAGHEADPAITHFHLKAHTPQAAKIRLVSPAIPALGWRAIWLRAVEASQSAPAVEAGPLVKALLPLGLRLAQSRLGGKLLERLSAGDEVKPPFIIENEHFQVEANRQDGTLTVLDKRTNTSFSGLNRFVDGGDAGDEYNYCPPAKDSYFTPELKSIKAYRHKQIPTLEIHYEMEIPLQLSQDRVSRAKDTARLPITSTVSLAPGSARIEVRTLVDNQARDHRLRAHFPAPFMVEQADHDGHFQVVRRPVGVPPRGEDWVEDPRPEVPQGAFTDISTGKIGLMIANRGLPEVEVIHPAGSSGSEVVLTLLRSVGWLSRDDMSTRRGHAGPASETPGAQLPGTWIFEYAIVPHEGDWGAAFQQAYAYQTPIRGIETGLHDGEIPNQGSFIAHSPAEFVISTVKETEDGKGWLVRGCNITSEPLMLDVQLLKKFSRVTQVNLAEEAIRPLEFGENGSLSLQVTGHQIVSIRLED